MRFEYELKQDYDDRWYVIEKYVSNDITLSDVVLAPKNGTLAECLTLVRQHDRMMKQG